MDNFSSSPKEHQADLRLRRIFGITLDEYNIRLADQNGVCKICKRPPNKVRLAVDHDHKLDRIKIKTSITKDRHYKGFATAVAPNGKVIQFFAATRKLAKIAVHLVLRKMSIRGLLCVNCNRGLQKFYDKPERFEAAALYLREFEKRVSNEKILTVTTNTSSSIVTSSSEKHKST